VNFDHVFENEKNDTIDFTNKLPLLYDSVYWEIEKHTMEGD